MKEKWIMTLHNVQYEEEGITEATLDTEIAYTKEPDGERVITYQESETTGMEGSDTQLRISPDNMVTIVRTGTFRTNLVVQTGKKHFCNYGTPFGEFAFGVSAKFIHNELTDEGGMLALRYTVDANSSLLSDNEILIQIKKHVC